MKKRLKAFSRTTIALLTAALVCSPFTKAYADDTVDSLEKQTNGLQNQLDSLNQDLTSLSAEITDLASKIEDTDASVQKAELDLAAAKLDEQLQYDAMKKRIKYMYETGNTSLLQIIFSSESMGDFLNKAEFVKNITEYDRNMLDELQKVHELVAKKDSDLKAEQASLAEMKTNLDQQEQELNEAFGEENWKSMPDEIFWQLRFEPAKWTAEKHIIKVYVGTDGAHQDEFLRGDHPETMFRGSIATPSLEAAIINAKYVNSNPLDRISRDFQANGLNLSKQTMSNWTVWTAERYLLPVCDLMRKRQLEAHVNQSDETPVDVIHDGRPAGSKSYMWVHITGELSPVPPIIVYEYQKTRHSDHPKAYYKDFDGVLVTDGLEQYHKLERDLAGVKNANCMAHARRHFANAIKAIGKSNPEAVEASVAYKALVRIGAIYDLEGALKELTPEERLNERQASIKPLVEEFFAWLRKIQADRSVLPKSETAKGINYCLNQEAYLKVFLSDGEVPIDNLASERALRTFTIGRKNWMTINTVRGADASAIIYSVTETARANGLNVYYYMKHLLTELTQVVRADGSIDEKELEPLMPWSKDLPAECYKRRK